MIDEIAEKIETRLKGLGIFKAVERTITANILQSPPAAAVFLAYDREIANKPSEQRELGWDIMLMIPALGAAKGTVLAGRCIDAVREAFVGWFVSGTGGVMPAKVPEVRLEGVERTVIVYSVRVTIEVFPATLAKNGV